MRAIVRLNFVRFMQQLRFIVSVETTSQIHQEKTPEVFVKKRPQCAEGRLRSFISFGVCYQMNDYSSSRAFAWAARAACDSARWATAAPDGCGGSCECTLLNANMRSCRVWAYARQVRRVQRQRTLFFSGNTFSA